LKVSLTVDRPGAAPGPVVEMLAMVDSGAFRTCLPRQIAYDLGITDAELVEDPTGGVGVGSTFRFWTTPLPIRAGIGLFAPAADGSTQPWGPGFSLDPAFTEHDQFLLGRADFFRAHKVSFAEEPDGSVFYLDRD
jgi:hypothetical protein